MKNRRQVFFSILIILCVIQPIFFAGCKPDKKQGKSVYKPNIYIYPEENIQLKVTIDFPMGGKIMESIPNYNNGWEINVDTNGVINNEYAYLYYESWQPDIWQRGEGWLVEVDQLGIFFNENMTSFGFEEKEIEDFNDYWIPRLNACDYYVIYPQTSDLIDDVIRLNFSKSPDRILRLFYLIEGAAKAPDYLIEPEIESFSREGYFVTEWGVIL